MSKPTAIIFDLDGTLIHSAPDLRFAANIALAEIGRDPLDLPTIVSFVGNGVEKLVERCLRVTGEFSEALHRETLDRFLHTYKRNMSTLTRPYPGVVPVLDGLREAGVMLGICTNKPTAPAREICQALGLDEYFTVIIGAEEDLPKKPDPSPLLRCLALMKCDAADALYVGDSAIDYQTARNAGVPFKLFSGGYLNDPLVDLPDNARFDTWDLNSVLTK